MKVMKLFSFKKIFRSTAETFLRFPIALLFAIAGTIAAVYLSNLGYDDQIKIDKGYPFLFTFALGLTLFIFIQLFAERKKLKKSAIILIKSAGVLLLAGYYFSMPEKIEEITTVRFLILYFSMHCFIAVSPFFGKNEINGFWHFNKELFVRVLFSALYAGVLYLGLVLAMLATDELFGVRIDGDRYFQLWIIITGIILTWIFLAGVPENISELEKTDKYPLGLKIFTQYILLPLVLLYILILYIYAGKIIINQDWPSGWVSSLVLTFSVMGIFSLLLLYPIKNNENNKWIKIYTKWFYFLLIPLIVLLVAAVWRRISEYGITENRYFVIVLTVWLTGITIYQIVNKFRNIKIIPLSLGVLALLSSFGPWGAFSVSKNSQLLRFKNTLEKYEILVNDKVNPNSKVVSFKDQQEITSIVEYINNMHGFQAFQPFFKEKLDSMITDSVYFDPTNKILSLIGVDYISEWQSEDIYKNQFYYTGDFYTEEMIDISGFDYMLNYSQYLYYDEFMTETMWTREFRKDTDSVQINLDSLTKNFSIKINEFEPVYYSLPVIIEKLAKKTEQDKNYSILPKDMTFFKENEKIRVRLCINNISGMKEEKGIRLSELNATIYIDLK